MATVVWTDEAVVRLGLIARYIAMFDPVAAERMSDRLIAASQSLSDFPRRGRPGIKGTRELPSIRPYVIVYDVVADEVRILDIRHGAQRPRD